MTKNNKVVLIFSKVQPLRTFGDKTILSVFIDKFPKDSKFTVYVPTDANIVEDYIKCAHPDISAEVSNEAIDTNFLQIGQESYGLSTNAGYKQAVSRYFGNKNNFDFSKPEEAIYFVNDRVVKFFKDEKVVKSKVERARLLGGLVPVIDKVGRNYYSYKLISGKTMYESLVPGLTSQFLEWCSAFLWNHRKINLTAEQQNEFARACTEFYKDKTLERVNLYWSTSNQKDALSTVNGIEVSTLAELINKIDWKDLSHGRPSRFHGDLQFDNVIFSPGRKSKFVLLDWRHDFSGIIEYGDIYYDLAKLYGGLIVPYNLIKKNLFTFKQNFHHVQIDMGHLKHLDSAKREFVEFVQNRGYDYKKIRLLTGIIFINMSPLHTEPFNFFLHHLGKLMLTKILNA